MAGFWTAKFVVTDEEWLREAWRLSGPLRRTYGCVQARLLRHATEPDTYFSFYEFGRVEDAKSYLQATQLRLSGDGLAHFLEFQSYDFYGGEAFDAAALRTSGKPGPKSG